MAGNGMATRVKAGCVKAALRRATSGGTDAESVASVARNAGRSPRTIYRVLGYPDEKPIALDLADRLVLAADSVLSFECPEDGDYVDA